MLKNKDGTKFTLVKPNPLVKNQIWTQKDNLILHNFSWQSFSIDSLKNNIQPKKREVVVIPATESSKIVHEPTPEPETKPEPEPTKSEYETIQYKNTVIVHLLPLISWKEKEDALYGEKYKTPQYGEKVTFEAIILERSDLAISLWASKTFVSKNNIIDAQTVLTSGSIIFPKNYKSGEKFTDYRWWKINSTKLYAEGIVVVAVITDTQPSFD